MAIIYGVHDLGDLYMGIKAGVNMVLVRPEADLRTLHGVVVAGDWDEQLLWSVYGRVVGVPSRLWYADHVVGNDFVNQFISEYGLEADVDMELREGDRVVFRYNVRMDDDGIYEDDEGLLLMMRYDSIYGVWRDGWYGLNGVVFVDGEEVIGRCGAVRRLLHHPGIGPFEVGERIKYRSSVRVELEGWGIMGGIRKVAVKDILCFK